MYPTQWGIGHTYTSSGTYTATLSVGGCGPNASSGCLGPPIRQLGTVTITVSGSSGTSLRLNVPNGGETYSAGDSVTLSWSAGGISALEFYNYKIGYEFLPVDGYRNTLTVGTMLPIVDAETLSALSGSKTLVAPNGGWWSVDSQKGSSLGSRYLARVAIGKYDTSVCPAGQPIWPNQQTRSESSDTLARAVPQRLVLSIAPCYPYRIVAIDESDSVFTINQPRLSGTYSSNPATKTVSANVTVTTPNGCKPYTLSWRGGSTSSIEPAVSYSPPSNCSSAQYTANYSHTFNYHIYGTYETVGGADLSYNSAFADSFNVPIPSAL